MTANGRSNEPDRPDPERLAEEMEKAIAQARKATAELPPLEELAALQEAMAGLAQMGALTEKMRLAAEEDQQVPEQPDAEADQRPQEGRVPPDDASRSGHEGRETG
jgi:hypothetical protein